MSNHADNDNIAWPEKTGELYHNHFDSTLWNDFSFRDDDIIISTWAKSGTTWVQQILAQLIFNGATNLNVAEMSPWVDFRLPPKEVKFEAIEAQTHRRFLKTHLPVDALVYSPKVKYLYVARDGRDVLWSYFNHHSKHNDLFYQEINAVGGPGVEPARPPQHEIHEYFQVWLENDGYPRSFNYMRAHAELAVPLGGAVWEGGAKTFIHKGTNGRWRDVLTEEDIANYESRALEELGPECAQWLASGEL